mmetsp:Transcript_10000/g.30768  ORF Transcript_10000/g.30768 Transcript_10000/m.30768 type:complete len:134 (+) Transcript_10000:316-717(+)
MTEQHRQELELIQAREQSLEKELLSLKAINVEHEQWKEGQTDASAALKATLKQLEADNQVLKEQKDELVSQMSLAHADSSQEAKQASKIRKDLEKATAKLHKKDEQLKKMREQSKERNAKLSDELAQAEVRKH